jgi:hypothetical protein
MELTVAGCWLLHAAGEEAVEEYALERGEQDQYGGGAGLNDFAEPESEGGAQ